MRGRRATILAGLCLAVVALARSALAFGQQVPQRVPPAVLKLILQHPTLDPYLNPAVADRGPLAVSDHLLAPGITPTRFGEPVRILGDQDPNARSQLRIRSFEQQGARAKVVVESRAKGVEATFLLERSQGWWSVLDAKVSKR